MRDITDKIRTLRIATAQAVLTASPETIQLIRDNRIPKGDPLPVAKVAAVQAAKDASRIIPYCHPLPVDYVGVDFELLETAITVTVTIKVLYKTGVEMEALTAASVAALTLYDMLKMLDETMEITGVKLLRKTGGKSDFRQGIGRQLKAAVVVISDSVSAGTKNDLSGQLIADRLKAHEIAIADYTVIPDDPETIKTTLTNYADTQNLDLVLTTGGTGMSPRDNTPEATAAVIEKIVPGIGEMLRDHGQERTPYSMLSRGLAGLRGQTLIINLPGSKNGVRESLDALFPYVLHGFKILRGGGHPSEQEDKPTAAGGVSSP